MAVAAVCGHGSIVAVLWQQCDSIVAAVWQYCGSGVAVAVLWQLGTRGLIVSVVVVTGAVFG